MDLLTSFIAIFLVLATSILVTIKIDLKSRLSSLLSIYLFSVANIVISTQIASLLNLLNNRWMVLALHLAWLIVTLIFSSKGFRFSDLKQWITLPGELRSLFKQHPLYIWLAALIVGITIFNAFIAIRVPPNTNDAMIQHMSRVGYWLQHGSMAPWNTPLVLQVIYPPVAQLQILWTVLFSGVDRFAPLIQWIAVPVSALAIYGLAAKLGWSRERSMLSALLWMTLPQIVLQSTSTQNDLVSSGLLMVSLFFLVSGLKNQQKTEVFISALGLALAMGTKQTIILILPALAILLVLVWIKSQKPTRILLSTWVISAAAFFLVFGSYIYIQNTYFFKNPLGPDEVISETVNNEETGFWRNAVHKMGRVIYQTFDLTEIPYRDYGPESKSMWLYNQAANIKAVAGFKVFGWLNLDLDSAEGIVNYPQNSFSYKPLLTIQEDVTWFGPMIFLMIPAILVSLIISIRNKDVLSIGPFLIWLDLFLVLNFFKNGWTPNQSRYYVLSVTATMPLVSVLWTTARKRAVNYLILVAAVVFMVFTVMMNFAKPLIGAGNIWNKTDAELRGMQSVGIRDSIDKIDSLLPEGSIVGVVLTGESFDYPLFGRDFSHKLIPANPASQINDPLWLENQQICYILIADNAEVAPDENKVQLIDNTLGWTIYKNKDPFCKK